MKAVFLGGSRRLSRLNEAIRRRLDEIIDRRLWIFVGDANGADRALQEHLAQHNYSRVVVYSVADRLRNNVGSWQVHVVQPPPHARGFDLFSAKDLRMAEDAACGLMLWDGKSRGTMANIRNLLAHGKPVAVYCAPARKFINLRAESDLSRLSSLVVGEAHRNSKPRRGAKKAHQQRLALG